MGEPKAPDLPTNAPQDVRDFVDCKLKTITLASGKLDWLEMPKEIAGLGKPTVTYTSGKAPGEITITVTIGGISVGVPASVKDGKLSVEIGGATKLLPVAAKQALADWVESLNAWLKANGCRLGPPIVDDAKKTVTLTKVCEKPGVAIPPGVAPKPGEQPKSTSEPPKPGAVSPKPGEQPKPATDDEQPYEVIEQGPGRPPIIREREKAKKYTMQLWSDGKFTLYDGKTGKGLAVWNEFQGRWVSFWSSEGPIPPEWANGHFPSGFKGSGGK